ncbi:MAG TPA: M23 family peptidase [Firmicutes bacterium]|nr:M23 family peptidase [Bacillota bacterium]
METSLGPESNQKADNRRRTILRSFKWVALLMGLLVIYLAGIFANYQQTLSAHSINAADFAPLLPAVSRKEPEVETTARSADALASKPSIWPVGGDVTSGFGWRNSPWGEGSEFHQGIDIANSLGTPIVATADGRVAQSGWSGGYGNLVQIDHGNGIVTIYGHNSQVVVTEGQQVRKGQIIAYLGSTGRSTGPHVHYEIRVNDNAVDPLGFLAQY